jgi:hypothetical protein
MDLPAIEKIKYVNIMLDSLDRSWHTFRVLQLGCILCITALGLNEAWAAAFASGCMLIVLSIARWEIRVVLLLFSRDPKESRNAR